MPGFSKTEGRRSVDQLTRELLNRVQNDFPLDRRPFRIIAEDLGITEDDCLKRLNDLIDQGILREIRPVINWKAAGFTALLIGMQVDEGKVDNVAGELNKLSGVTHNYLRDGTLNLWCTLTCESDTTKNRILSHMKSLDGVNDVKEFASEKTYKIGLVLDV